MPKIKPAEAILGFVDWLSARDDQVTISRHNNSQIIIDLAQRFIKENGWDIPDNLSEMEYPPTYE
jgi:hypothetical protein